MPENNNDLNANLPPDGGQTADVSGEAPAAKREGGAAPGKMVYKYLTQDDPLDPIGILAPAGSSPYGGPGMPPATRVLDSPAGQLSDYLVTLVDQDYPLAPGSVPKLKDIAWNCGLRAFHVLAELVVLVGKVYEFRDTKGEIVETVHGNVISCIENVATGARLDFVALQHRLRSPAQRAAAQHNTPGAYLGSFPEVSFESGPGAYLGSFPEVSFESGLAAKLGKLMIRQGELLLKATGHVKSPEYLAWERDVLACGQLPNIEEN